MSDRFRSRKIGRNHNHDVEDFQMKVLVEDYLDVDNKHRGKREERKAYRIHFYRGFVASRLSRLSLLAIHVALFFGFRFIFRNGYLGKSPPSPRMMSPPDSQHEPPRWTTQKFEVSESLVSLASGLQQKMISNVCSERKVVTPLRNESSYKQSDGRIPWTICMTINAGFYDFFQNWYAHFQILDLKMDMVLFAEDSVAYDRLSNAQFLNRDYTMVVNATTSTPITSQQATDVQPAKISSTSTGSSAEDSASSDEVFDAYSQKYKQLISNRPTRLLQVLCSGRNVLYIDSDTFLKKSPLPFINKNYMDGVDISVALDHVKRKKYAHGFGVCTGFVAIKANPKTVHFVYEWERRCHDSDSGGAINDQTAFNLAYEAFWLERQESGMSIIKLQGLPVELFPNGEQYFKKYDEGQREDVVLAHANWIVGGKNKRQNLMKHGLWDPVS
ncbi:unnamed protein product [Cylindrotheca closterium]|uniref:Nucleotide-diphospho-sugar transferase domain-containing protein n=1 Tax=Cylindrotheca closterium TaxID=2856 RepID=A0AAD2PU80_9STRA|nr:unnamed protein product [Cylindrotheca closterium]